MLICIILLTLYLDRNRMEKANQTEQKLESNFESEMTLAFKNEEQLDRQKYDNVPW